MDAVAKRKVSPRAPTLALDEAMVRIAKMYKAEGRHATPIEVALKHIGYSSKNGAAVQALASLGYWGLVERPKDGLVMVSKAVEDYQYTPDEEHRHSLLIGFLRKPGLFASLLDKYHDRLPSDATMQYDLIQNGFIPSSAATCLAVFKKSVEFTRYFERPLTGSSPTEFATGAEVDPELQNAPPNESASGMLESDSFGLGSTEKIHSVDSGTSTAEGSVDRIPIRLAGGRRAWLTIPIPFFNTDKERLKKHIDLLITDDEDELV
jgi:hypothetical protein